MGQYVVVYSGGYDSTALLTLYAKSSAENYPIKAITVSNHYNIDKGQLSAQYRAQTNYLKWAESNGYHIEHIRIASLCSENIKKANDSRAVQFFIWLCAIAPYVNDGDEVIFGYIHEDCFWHWKQEFIDAFNALIRLKGISAKILFPFEFKKKEEILKLILEYKIPKKCVFTCERPRNGKACGKCHKCLEIKEAINKSRKIKKQC